MSDRRSILGKKLVKRDLERDLSLGLLALEDYLGMRSDSPAPQALWVIDPVSGSDSAAGALATPLKTLSELLRRVAVNGTWSVTANTTVLWLADTPAGVDLNALRVRLINGANLYLQCAVGGVAGTFKTVNATAVLSAVTTRVRTTTPGTAWTNTGPSGLTLANVNLLIKNTTRNTGYWINSDLTGGQVRTSEPAQSFNPTANTFTIPTQTSTVNGDSYQVLAPLKVNLTGIDAVSLNDLSHGASSRPGQLIMYGLWIPVSAGSNDQFYVTGLSGNLVMRLCRFDVTVYVTGVWSDNCSYVAGLGCLVGEVSRILGGQVKLIMQVAGICDLDGDLLISNALVMVIGTMRCGNVAYFNITGGNIQVGLDNNPIGKISCQDTLYAGHIQWGNVTSFKVSPGCQIVHSGSTAVLTFTACAGFTIGGQSTFVTVADRTQSPPTLARVACTWVAVDAAAGLSVVDLATLSSVSKAT